MASKHTSKPRSTAPRHVQNRGRQDAYVQGILRALLHLQTHLDEPHSLERLAKVARFSPYHFHRIFTAVMGEPVKEHIRRLRLERAALKLAHEDQQVVMLAFEAGYETHESFTRAFTTRFGMSPLAYREAARRQRKQFVQALEAEHEELKRRLLKSERGPALEVRIEKHPARHAVFSRHFGSYFDCGPAWERVCGFAHRKRLFSAKTLMIGISHDSPDITPEDLIRYDACVTVEPPLPETEGEIGLMELPASLRAVIVHRGSYNDLHHTYRRIFGSWLPQSNYALVNLPDYEIYLNNPASVPPEQLLTEICIPVKPIPTKSKSKHEIKK